MSSTNKTLPNIMLSPTYWEEARRMLSAADAVMARIIANYPEGQLESRGAPFETLCRSIVGQQISVKAADSVWAKLEALFERGQQAEPLVGEVVSSIAQVSRPEQGGKKNALEIPRSSRGMTIAPEVLIGFSEEQLRGCGLSRQKVAYLRNIAEFFDADHTRLERSYWEMAKKEEVIAQLTSIKGVGKWTAEMFLMFHVMHPDVFSVGDIGLQKAILRHYLNDSPLRSTELRDGVALKAGSRSCAPTAPDWNAMSKKEMLISMGEFAEQWVPYRTVASWYLWRSLDPVPVAY